MRFILKTTFFLQAAFIFLAFNIFAVLKILYDPEQRAAAFMDLALGGGIYVLVIGVPWFFVAKSSLDAARGRIEDLRGSLDYLRKNEAAHEKITHAAHLYNQEVDTLDEVMGQFPTRQLAGFFFGYRKPAYFDLGVDGGSDLAPRA